MLPTRPLKERKRKKCDHVVQKKGYHQRRKGTAKKVRNHPENPVDSFLVRFMPSVNHKQREVEIS
jgi:hypothetical protein